MYKSRDSGLGGSSAPSAAGCGWGVGSICHLCCQSTEGSDEDRRGVCRALSSQGEESHQQSDLCVCACMCECACVHMCMCVHVYVCMNICVCVRGPRGVRGGMGP